MVERRIGHQRVRRCEQRGLDGRRIDAGPLGQRHEARYPVGHRATLRRADQVAALAELLGQRQAALALARKDGEARLEAGRKEPASTLPGAALTVSRAQPEDLAPELLEAVLRADAKALPAWVGMDLPGTGYAVARVAKVLERDPAAVDAKQAQQQYGQAWAIAEAQAYYDALKTRYKVEVHAPPAASRSTDDAPR